MTARHTTLLLLLVLAGSAGLIFTGITTGLPSVTRLEIELGGPAAVEAVRPQLTAFLNGNRQDRTEFLAFNDRNELANLSPYFDQLRSYHPDEQYILKVISGMVRNHDFQPRNYIYPPFFFYQVGAGLGIGKVLGWLNHNNTDIISFLQHPDQMAQIYLAARITIAIMALAAIIMIFFCGRILFNNAGAGITAALLLAAIPLYALAGKFIKPDIPCVLWSMVALFFALRAFRNGRSGNYILSGIAVGLAAASKYPGVLSALLPAGYFVARLWPTQAQKWRDVIADRQTQREFLALCGAGIGCLAAFVAVNPSILLDTTTFRHDLTWISHVLRESHFFADLGEFTFCLLSDGFCYHTGALLTPLLAGGALYVMIRPRRELLPLLPVIAVYLVMGSRGRPGSDAYILPALPLLCLTATALLAEIHNIYWRRGIIAAAVLSSSAYSWAIAQSAAGENIRLTASRWIQTQIPAGCSIGRTQYPVSYRTVMTPPQRYPNAALLTNPQAAACDYFIVTSFEWEAGFSPWRVRLASARIPPAPAAGYELTKLFAEPPRVFGILPMRQRGYVSSPYLDVIFPVIAIYQKKGSAQHVQR